MQSQDGKQPASPPCIGRHFYWLLHISHHVQTQPQNYSQYSTPGRTTRWLELSCKMKPSAIPDVHNKKKLLLFFSPLWKCLRINRLDFIFPAESLNDSLLVMSLWKVDHFRSSTGEFDKIVEARLRLIFWAFLLYSRHWLKIVYFRREHK